MHRGFVYFRPLQIVFVRVTGAYATTVPEAWRQLDEWFTERGTDIGRVTRYGLAQDNPRSVKPEECRYDACVEAPPHLLNEAFDELRNGKLPAGPFARQRYTGPYEGIGDALTAMRDVWVKAESVTLDHRRPLLTVYLNNPRELKPCDLKTDLCMPVLTDHRARK